MTSLPPPSADLAAWLEWLERLDPSRIELGLERVARVYAQLPQLDRSKTRVITVAGTNGKGTCVEVLGCALARLGRCVLQYSSPHLLRFTERIRIDQTEIDEPRLIAAFSQVAAASGGVPLTYFEFTTLAMLVVAAMQRPDDLILEVGLGGRLDAVNLIDADLTIITSIDLDHMHWLGADRETIGREKAGILRRGIPLVAGDKEIPRAVVSHARAIGSPLWQLEKDFQFQSTAAGSAISFGGTRYEWIDGPLHPRSVAVALAALALCEPRAVEGSLEWIDTIALPGRMQHIQIKGQACILDVAHNPAAWRALRDCLLASGEAPCDLIFALMRDKDCEEAIRILAPVVTNWYPLDLKIPRALSAAEFSKFAVALGLTTGQTLQPDYDSLAGFLQHRVSSNKPLLVTGSFYTVASLLNLIRNDDL